MSAARSASAGRAGSDGARHATKPSGRISTAPPGTDAVEVGKGAGAVDQIRRRAADPVRLQWNSILLRDRRGRLAPGIAVPTG
jgi:hypothetical protein